jgi:hypothetical protein
VPDEPPFPGFDTPHYTQVPNTLFDVLLAAGTLTEAELRVLLYICRRTFGFGKDADAISLSQMTDGRRLDHGAGCRRDAAVRATKGLERKGIITITRLSDPRSGPATNVYALRWRVSRQSDGVTGVVTPSDQGSPAGTPTLDSLSDPQKIEQKTESQEGSWRPLNAPTADEVQRRGLGRSVPPGGR